MRWILVVLLMCNGIYFLWQNYLVESESVQQLAPSGLTEGAGKLVLLSEVGAAPADLPEPEEVEVVVDEVPPTPVEAPAVDAGPAMCWLIGPFSEEVSGKQVVSRLAALDISLKLQTIEISGAPDYWVHIPPQISRKGAIKLLRELQAKKIDSFLITEGELTNGISLGFFTQEKRANAVYDKRVKEGYAAAVKVVPRTHTELWAVFDAGEYGKFSDVLWDKIKVGNKGLERRKNYCDKIASTGHFD